MLSRRCSRAHVNHPAALGLKVKNENRRSERQIDSWIWMAEQYVANHPDVAVRTVVLASAGAGKTRWR
jgi:hypothetical protein